MSIPAAPATAVDPAMLRRIISILNDALFADGKVVLLDCDLANFVPQDTSRVQ